MYELDKQRDVKLISIQHVLEIFVYSTNLLLLNKQSF
jgi:hypothetical protein